MGIFEKIKNGLSKTRKNITGLFDSFTGANDEFFDELEETLITADLGVDLAVSTVDQLRANVKAGGIRGGGFVRVVVGGGFRVPLPPGPCRELWKAFIRAMCMEAPEAPLWVSVGAGGEIGGFCVPRIPGMVSAPRARYVELPARPGFEHPPGIP